MVRAPDVALAFRHPLTRRYISRILIFNRHLPERWFYDFNANTRAIVYDSYSYDFSTPKFTGDLLTNTGYLDQLQYWKTTYGLPNGYKKGDQINPRTSYPCKCRKVRVYYRFAPHCLSLFNISDQPVPMSQRYGMQSLISGVDREDYVFGIDRLSSNYSQSDIIGRHAQNAIKRLANQNKPWIVTVSFENPRKSIGVKFFVLASNFFLICSLGLFARQIHHMLYRKSLLPTTWRTKTIF